MQEAGTLNVLFKPGGPEATNSTTALDRTGLLAEELGLCTPSRSGSVCLSVWQTVWLTLPTSQRILFFTTQMFGAVCCAALSCVYNKEVLVCRRRDGNKVGEWVLLRRGGGHCTVGINTGWCQLSLWPPTSQYSIPFFPFFLPTHPFPEGQIHLHVSWKSYCEASRGGRDPLRGDDVNFMSQLKLLTYSTKHFLHARK